VKTFTTQQERAAEVLNADKTISRRKLLHNEKSVVGAKAFSCIYRFEGKKCPGRVKSSRSQITTHLF
jgi:hypothetical protein